MVWIKIKNWETKLETEDFSHFKTLGEGKLRIDYGITYCDLFQQTSSDAIKIEVKQCLPHKIQ